MPEHKNQHYVPRFYFKLFTDKDVVNSYYLGENNFFTDKINDLCSKDYFYSKNSELEKSFGPLKGKWSNLLESIIENQSFSHFPIRDWVKLRLFLLFQMYRTRKSKRKQ